MLFEMLQGDPLRGGWRDKHVKEALDLCLACKGCKSDCPVNVDMATFKAEFLAHYNAGRLRPVSACSMGLIFWWARLAARTPGLVNVVTHTPPVSDVAKVLGMQLDALGVGPLETPSRAALAEPCLTLKAYPAAPDTGPVLLLVPAPIKRAQLWDLAPWASVVRRCIATGLRVYLLQWEQPGERECAFGLADYADRLILDCGEAMRAETGQPSVFLAGHSLGGTLAALFAALHPDRLRGLIVLGAPLHFGRQVGVFGPVVAASPSARLLTVALGTVPGSWLDTVCWLADPGTVGWSRWVDWLNSLPDPEALWTHLLAERWTPDELPLPQRFFEDTREWLYREDRFMQGTLVLGARRVAPQQVTAPLLSVVARRCSITPPEAILPFHEAVQSTAKELLWYEGDTGVALQHIGPLVGRKAHQHLWPAIIRWIQAQAT